MTRTTEAIEQDLARCRERREALAMELETAAGQGKADRMEAYRRMCETCRCLVDELEMSYRD